MKPATKLYYLQNMSIADISTIMTPGEFKNYIELHHRTKRVMPKNISKIEIEDDINENM